MQLFLNNVLTSFTQVVILFLIAMVGFVCHKIGVYTEKASRMTTDLLFYIVAPAIKKSMTTCVKDVRTLFKNNCITHYSERKLSSVSMMSGSFFS